MTAHMSPASTPGPTKYVTVTFLADGLDPILLTASIFRGN